MVELKHSNKNPAPIGFLQSYNRKKAIKFFLTLSVFSLSVYMFAFSMQVLACSFEKNFMFLLCNGLLVFIVKSSYPIGNCSPSESTINSAEHALKIDNIQKTELALMQSTKASYPVQQVVVVVDDDDDEQVRETGQLITVKEEEKEVSVARDHEGDQGEENGLITIGDHEENDLQGIELLSTEELNKKCEEFIRKMREGINSI